MNSNSRTLHSVISHDSLNNRIYLMHFDPRDLYSICAELYKTVQQYGYTKIIVKIPAPFLPTFTAHGYVCEAHIPSFYSQKEDLVFLAAYFNDERKQPETEKLKAFQDLLLSTKGIQSETQVQTNKSPYSVRKMDTSDTLQMTQIFQQVFPTYPFPVFEQQFLHDEIVSGRTRYFGIFDNQKLIGISSAECCGLTLSAEMTDFAVLPEYRGKGLSSILLNTMEDELTHCGYKTFYTICRLHSLSMNKTFMKAGYTYTGTLTNNTQISGSIQSMNIWYKKPSFL